MCLALLDVLHVFVLGDTDVEVPLHFKVYFYVENVRVRLPKGPARGSQGGPKGCRDTALAVPIRRRPPKSTNAPSMDT